MCVCVCVYVLTLGNGRVEKVGGIFNHKADYRVTCL